MKTINHCATFRRRSSVPIRCRYIYMYDTYISKFKERMATSIDHLLQRKRTVPDERQGKTDASRREHDFCLQRYICWSLMSIIKQINARDAHKCCCLRKNRDDLFLIRAPMLMIIIIMIISFHISIMIMQVREKLYAGPVPRSVSKYLALNLIECGIRPRRSSVLRKNSASIPVYFSCQNYLLPYGHVINDVNNNPKYLFIT